MVFIWETKNTFGILNKLLQGLRRGYRKQEDLLRKHQDPGLNPSTYIKSWEWLWVLCKTGAVVAETGRSVRLNGCQPSLSQRNKAKR